VHRENIIELLREEQSDEGLVRYFLWNNKEYKVTNRYCLRDEATLLLKAILQQAVNDYLKLSCKKLTKEEDRWNFETAKGFLFDDNYCIQYGDIEISVRDIIFFLSGHEPNMDMFRAGIERQLDDNKKKR
jgi:hypothetical protein